MSKKYNRWEKFYNQLNMIFHGTIAISMIPFAWAFLETQRQFPDPPLINGYPLLSTKIVGSFLCVVVMLLSYQYGQNILSNAKAQKDVDSKLKLFIREKKKDFLLLELGALIAFAGLYLSKDHLFTLLYVAVLLMFSTKRPTYLKITDSLEIKDEEVNDWIKEHENKND
ncbi:MAG: hypothetical protein RIC06_09835 [Cyclobacteriaceae bacterium]